MPRSPAPNISVPVLALAVLCCVEVVLLLDPELLSSLPHAARNSANALAPAVPPTALRNRLRSDGSVASRSTADCSSCIVASTNRCGDWFCGAPSADQADMRQLAFVRLLTERSVIGSIARPATGYVRDREFPREEGRCLKKARPRRSNRSSARS